MVDVKRAAAVSNPHIYSVEQPKFYIYLQDVIYDIENNDLKTELEYSNGFKETFNYNEPFHTGNYVEIVDLILSKLSSVMPTLDATIDLFNIFARYADIYNGLLEYRAITASLVIASDNLNKGGTSDVDDILDKLFISNSLEEAIFYLDNIVFRNTQIDGDRRFEIFTQLISLDRQFTPTDGNLIISLATEALDSGKIFSDYYVATRTADLNTKAIEKLSEIAEYIVEYFDYTFDLPAGYNNDFLDIHKTLDAVANELTCHQFLNDIYDNELIATITLSKALAKRNYHTPYLDLFDDHICSMLGVLTLYNSYQLGLGLAESDRPDLTEIESSLSKISPDLFSAESMSEVELLLPTFNLDISQTESLKIVSDTAAAQLRSLTGCIMKSKVGDKIESGTKLLIEASSLIYNNTEADHIKALDLRYSLVGKIGDIDSYLGESGSGSGSDNWEWLSLISRLREYLVLLLNIIEDLICFLYNILCVLAKIINGALALLASLLELGVEFSEYMNDIFGSASDAISDMLVFQGSSAQCLKARALAAAKSGSISGGVEAILGATKAGDFETCFTDTINNGVGGCFGVTGIVDGFTNYFIDSLNNVVTDYIDVLTGKRCTAGALLDFRLPDLPRFVINLDMPFFNIQPLRCS